MSAQHTQGRLRVGQHLGSLSSFCIHMDVGDKGRGAEIVEAVCGLTTEQRLANARRLALCWNALIEFPTDDLEACPPGGLFHLAAHANDLVVQRDELLEALKQCREMVGHPDNIAIIDAAIAKAEGGAV